MKIRIEMTAEELTKGTELCASILPGIDISSYFPTERQQIETKCNIYEMNNITDPETGMVSEIEIKTHFIMWMLRKLKPFVATFITLWHMFTDFCEDIQLMMGDITVLHNGEDLSEKLYKMAEESDYFHNSDEQFVEPIQQLSMEPIYSVHYKGDTLAEIVSNSRYFYLTEEEAMDFATSKKTDERYNDIHPLYCQKGYNGIDTKLLNSAFFEYRGYHIKKDSNTDRYIVIANGHEVIDRRNNILEAMSVIDFRSDCTKFLHRVYTTDKNKKNINQIFVNKECAKTYYNNTADADKCDDLYLISFSVPAYFDIDNIAACTISYRSYNIDISEDRTCTIDDMYFNTFNDAMDYIDEISIVL